MRSLLVATLLLVLLPPASHARQVPLVAVLDTGVDGSHPALAGAVWTNPADPVNGADDDGNGHVDDVHGWDFVAGDADPADEHGHGTHAAGAIAGRGRRFAGIARQARILPVRVLDEHNRGTTEQLAAGIDYAVAAGAHVLNLSLLASEHDPGVDQALQRATGHGVVVVVSAGNQGADLDLAPSFPACSAQPNVVTVTSTTPAGTLSAFANHGACIDVGAPGERIAATRRGGGYERRTGTSTAAPQVAAALARALVRRPGATAEQLLDRVRPRRRARVAGCGHEPPRTFTRAQLRRF